MERLYSCVFCALDIVLQHLVLCFIIWHLFVFGWDLFQMAFYLHWITPFYILGCVHGVYILYCIPDDSNSFSFWLCAGIQTYANQANKHTCRFVSERGWLFVVFQPESSEICIFACMASDRIHFTTYMPKEYEQSWCTNNSLRWNGIWVAAKISSNLNIRNIHCTGQLAMSFQIAAEFGRE